ncbi:S41 family peptidase [Niveibacterium sp. COAC-50]|uniref:S41 family peptidase n=1 Tax=Niveibacterium sp. COAC-50 TaxID=2729384 RepID=UPI001555B20B|nr:S41 family peptidase [Niveibacterium sp. COAC-50]
MSHVPAYLRFPTVSGDTLVFVTDDDLWSVPLAGGVARRISGGRGLVGFPRFSPCGKWLAFIATDESHSEVYVMPAQGGAARRLTWLGAHTAVTGWTPDGRVVVASNADQPFFHMRRLFTVALDAPLPVLLPWGMASEASWSADGACVLGRNTSDPALWKRYRGGTVGHLWVDVDGKGEFAALDPFGDPRKAGNLACPMWIGDRIWFISDHEGIGNLYSCEPSGAGLRRHTEHGEHYVRHASTDGTTIVYQSGGDVYRLNPAGGDATRIEIEVPAARPQLARKFVSGDAELEALSVHPDGHTVALAVRGKAVSLPLWEGAMRQLGEEQGARYRLPVWLAEGVGVVMVSDASGEERLELHADEGVSVLEADFGRVTGIVAAPHGLRVVVTNHRNELWLADFVTREVRLLDRCDYRRIDEPAFSPDGAWLAYDFSVSRATRAIKLLEIATGRSGMASGEDFDDFSPAWDPSGKYLYFLSTRAFEPVYDEIVFDLSFPRATRPYLVALQADGVDPFEPLPRGFGDDEDEDDEDEDDGDEESDSKEEGDKKAEQAERKRPPKPVVVELEGLADRVRAFPVGAGRYGRIDAAKGIVYWTLHPVTTESDEDHDVADALLQSWDMREQKLDTVLGDVAGFLLALPGKALIADTSEGVRAFKIGEKPKEETEVGDFSRESGWVDLDRVQVEVDPRSEWRQMLREVWRLQRDQFWTADMSGVDWGRIWARYAPLVERISTREELSDLIWEMQGELATSHCYESGGDRKRVAALPLGHLGAEFSWDEANACYRIVRLVRGDAWREGHDSPLAAVGVQAKPGERLLAIDGLACDREHPPQARLVARAGRKVELLLADADGANRRRAVVRALPGEDAARYREWVEANRARVREASGGRLGYLHIPDMVTWGFSEFHRYLRTESLRDGLIVDARFNRGGHVSQLLLEKLARRVLGYDVSRWGAPEPYPAHAVAGPVVCVTNQHAGSDGDIFSHCFKLMGLGPLVGTRTWGGVIGIWPRHRLVDGTITTQPEFSFWFKDVGWGVENWGTEPDVHVDIAPQDYANGRDPQLDKAVDVALAALSKQPPRVPDFSQRPRLDLPSWPPKG